MKYADEFRDRAVATVLAERIKQTVRRPWTIMEVCGGQTHAIVRVRPRQPVTARPHPGSETSAGQIIEVVGSNRVIDHHSVRTCLYCRMRLSLVSTVAFSSLAVTTMI